MRVLLITDSLGLPRTSPEKVEYEGTWCFLLSERYDVNQFSYGGGTVEELLSQVSYFKMYSPDIVIVQSGIVDCAPRALTKCENHIWNKYKFTRAILRMCSPWLIRMLRKRGKTYTSIEAFRSSVRIFNKEFGDKLFWIGIVPSSADYEKKVPGITKNIVNYNKVLLEELGQNMIDLSNMPKDYIMSDFHHLNEKGHKYISERILTLKSDNNEVFDRG